ncbi:hypothetical protein CRT60_26285 [Azospirillum palustre]|uniref:Uncharacterized protein n=1 Tax=Azospirillum palustre TaxID=2044885 RepID=A0A2B8B6H0_9PROT|nr:hypothetical protein [Azospirillum palustre]PGH53400.1 hypothetical protein CRT60_26285 [Azospirillum palustre]
MSVSMVSASAVGQTYQRPQGPGKEIREGVDSLKKAVESGDMTAVQSAYDSLSKLQSDKQGSSSGTSSGSSTSASTGKDPLSKLLSSVGEALKSGDIGQVQQAMSKNGPPSGGPGGAGGSGGPGGAGGPPPNGPPPGEGGGSDELRSTVGSLAQSLQSGDVSGAQDSLSALSDMLKSAADSDSGDDSGSTDFLGTLKKNLSSLSSSLSSGDLSGAQSLFASLTPRGSQGVDITA